MTEWVNIYVFSRESLFNIYVLSYYNYAQYELTVE
jgi:hypothetical protein